MEERKSVKRSAHTQAIVDAMRNLPKGEVLTYEAIATATRLEKAAYIPYVSSAVQIMLKSDSAVFECVKGIGYKRLTPEEVIRSVNRGIRRTMRNVASDPLMPKPVREQVAELADPRTQAALRRNVRNLTPT
jgi:hypothetical protein